MTDEEIAAYVTTRLRELDTTPRDKRWRTKALGMTMGEAIASAPRWTMVDLRMTIGEVRVMRDCAKARGMNLRQWIRAAVATTAVCCDHVEPSMIPSLMDKGLLEPR